MDVNTSDLQDNIYACLNTVLISLQVPLFARTKPRLQLTMQFIPANNLRIL